MPSYETSKSSASGDIDWKAISGMRDKLVHQYFGVNWDILWDVVANKLPQLKTQLAGERNS